jgi:hypothetical protein
MEPNVLNHFDMLLDQNTYVSKLNTIYIEIRLDSRKMFWFNARLQYIR